MTDNTFIKDVEHDVDVARGWGRYVVAKRVAIVAAVTVFVQLAINYGWVTPDASGTVLHWLNAALDAVGFVVAVGITQPKVTPVSDPRNDAGVPLVPVTQVQANDVEAAPATLATPAV